MEDEIKVRQPEVKSGAHRKRDRIVVEVADAMSISLTADILTLEEMKDFPQLQNETARNRSIICLSACGFPQAHIAAALKITQPSVHEVLHRVDPNGMFRVSADAKRAIITRLAEGVAMSAINSITYDDLLALDADKRMSLAQKAVKISGDLNQSKHKHIDSNRLDNLINEMDKAEIMEEG